MDGLAALLKRDRVIIGCAIAVAAAVAWAYIAYEAHRMNLTAVCASAGMKMGGPDLGSWSGATILPLVVMWSVMMLAMMLPSAAPMLLTFAAVSRNRRTANQPYVPVTIFLTGYAAIWCGFSIIAALGQWLLHRAALLSPMMTSSSTLLAGLLLLIAGAFQFTRLKNSCLLRCRAPLNFIMTRWRQGWGGAFAMGIEHGAFCAGCCWALMALLFVLGVMNILWIAVLTIVVAFEKLLPRVTWFSRSFGCVLLGWGVWILAAGR
jgi:predicted metal-binding membrane protein